MEQKSKLTMLISAIDIFAIEVNNDECQKIRMFKALKTNYAVQSFIIQAVHCQNNANKLGSSSLLKVQKMERFPILLLTNSCLVV